MRKADVCVLLSTYNGEPFVREQIDSILNQQGVTVALYARDDGSSDSTRNILEEYEKRNQLTILGEDEKDNLGPAVSFMRMLYQVENSYDYYAFSDQDDVWKPEKLKKAIQEIGAEQHGKPILYCSNQIIYQDGVEKGIRFLSRPNISLANTLCGNSIAGCTMVMNRELKVALSEESHRADEELLRLRMHDVWVLLIALAIGKVVYDDDAYICYRIHDRNTVGIKKLSLIDKARKVIRLLRDPGKRNGRSRLAQEALLRCDPINDAYGVLERFARYRDGWHCKIALLRNSEVRRTCSENRALFIAKVLANWV